MSEAELIVMAPGALHPIWLRHDGMLCWLRCHAVYAPGDWRWGVVGAIRFQVEVDLRSRIGPTLSVVFAAVDSAPHQRDAGTFIARSRWGDESKSQLLPGTALAVYQTIPNSHDLALPVTEWNELVDGPGGPVPRFVPHHPDPLRVGPCRPALATGG